VGKRPVSATGGAAAARLYDHGIFCKETRLKGEMFKQPPPDTRRGLQAVKATSLTSAGESRVIEACVLFRLD